MSWIRGAATRAVLAAAKSRGLDLDQVIDKQKAAELSADPWATIPLSIHFGVIEACVRRLREPGFVIDIAQHVPVETYDVMGFAMRSAPNVGSAVEVARRYQPLYTAASLFEVEHDARGLRIWFRPSGPLPLAARCATESAIAQILAISRALSGVNIVPSYVGFRHAAPESLTRHNAFFGTRIEWEAELAAINFSKEDAALPIRAADPALHGVLLRAAEAALAEHQPSDSLVDRARRVTAELLPSGKLDVDHLATRLGLTSRTLRRRLSEQGTSFNGLRDEVRSELARRYLTERGLPLGEIAFLLGFADDRTFRRSFQRWTGSSPAQFRRGLPSRARVGQD